MKNITQAAFSFLMLSAASSVSALDLPDIDAGKAKAATCSACHGAEGISINDAWPNLAGQKSEYLEIALKAYRDGGRKNALMSPMASGLNDEDIVNLAAYFSSLKS